MIKKIINSSLLACIVILCSFSGRIDSFKSAQLKSSRVKQAYANKWQSLQQDIKDIGVSSVDFDLYLRVFKEEGQLEVFVKNTSGTKYQLLKTIAICAKSGSLGPKRHQGDGQVPEGFYDISAFNPYSAYHLSLKINYPNKSDIIKGKTDLGGDIMIHGECVTIGCIPLENKPIEEIYVLCVEAKNRGRIIKTDIYPCKFNDKNKTLLNEADSETLRFWATLKPAYQYFEANHILPAIITDKTGNYILSKPL